MSIEEARELVKSRCERLDDPEDDEHQRAYHEREADKALDWLTTEVKASMPCYRSYWNDGIEAHEDVDCPASKTVMAKACPSCEARQQLGVDSTVSA